MKTVFLVALMALAAADDVYVLQNLDMATLASTIGEFKKLVDCLVDKGPCSELNQSYKALAPEAIKEGCKKCTVELKQTGNPFFEILKENLPEDYKF